jgi:hypothetical protein
MDVRVEGKSVQDSTFENDNLKLMFLLGRNVSLNLLVSRPVGRSTRRSAWPIDLTV